MTGSSTLSKTVNTEPAEPSDTTSASSIRFGASVNWPSTYQECSAHTLMQTEAMLHKQGKKYSSTPHKLYNTCQPILESQFPLEHKSVAIKQ